jgi:hypothetical protein
MISEKKVNDLAESLWEKAGKPEGGGAAYKKEAERRLKDASREANADINQRDRSMGVSDNVDERLPRVTPSKQPIRPR